MTTTAKFYLLSNSIIIVDKVLPGEKEIYRSRITEVRSFNEKQAIDNYPKGMKVKYKKQTYLVTEIGRIGLQWIGVGLQTPENLRTRWVMLLLLLGSTLVVDV